MPEDFEVRGAESLASLAKAFKSAGNGKELRKELLRNLRAAGKPVTEGIRGNLGRELPQRGGLARRMAQSKVAVRNRLSGQNAGIRLDVKHSQYDLPAINRGRLRHKVFGKAWARKTQQVKPNLVDEAIDSRKPQMQNAVVEAMGDILNKIERSV